MTGIFLLFLACGDSTKTPSSSAETTPVQAPKTNKAPSNITLEAEKIEQTALTPSPMETRKAAEKEGLTTELSTLIQQRDFSGRTTDTDQIALRTGIILADTVLKIQELSKAELIRNLTQLHDNMKVIGAGEGLLFTIEELVTKVTNDALTRDGLLVELDEIVAYSRPNEGFGKDDTTGPLLQAGSWLASVNLLAQAMLKEDKTTLANSLFRHDKVAEYFLSYVKVEGKEKVPAGIMTTLRTTLESMIAIAKKDVIQKEDVETVAQATTVLLGLI